MLARPYHHPGRTYPDGGEEDAKRVHETQQGMRRIQNLPRTMTHPPTMVMKMAPRRMFNHLGKRLAKSFAPDTNVAEMLTHTCARHHETPAKNAATRPPGPSYWSIMAMRFQRYSPKTTPDTEVTTMPIIAMNERMSGNHSPVVNACLGVVMYRMKSAMLTPTVDQLAVQLFRARMINELSCLPLTVASCSQISPPLPAFTHIQTSMPSIVADIMMTLAVNNQRYRCGGMSGSGNCMHQMTK